ncbi:MAG: hypothetical protein NWR72_10805 [Bacteroidia bacterium]|nr:hypothetical protein [Bacteroidia bacterium]
MRQIYTFALLLLSASSFAQSAFFVGIGSDSNAVREIIESRAYLKPALGDSPDLWIRKVYSHQEIKYRFHEGILFSIEDERVFDTKELAEHVAETCKTYLGLLDFDTKQIDDIENADHFVAVTYDKVVEFILARDKTTEKYTCTLKVTSRRHGPRMQTESFVAQLTAP